MPPAQYRPRSPRLEQLGATILEHHEHHTVMANPEGNEFCVEPGPAHQQGQRTRLTRGYDRMVESAHRRPVGARPASTPGFLSGILEKANVCRSDGSFAPVYPASEEA